LRGISPFKKNPSRSKNKEDASHKFFNKTKKEKTFDFTTTLKKIIALDILELLI
jgi:hypothetical protein